VEVSKTATTSSDYNNFKTPGDYQAGGVQMIDLVEGYKVLTKRYGNSKMYDSKRMAQYVEEAGLEVEKTVETVGYYHSLMICKKKS